MGPLKYSPQRPPSVSSLPVKGILETSDDEEEECFSFLFINRFQSGFFKRTVKRCINVCYDNIKKNREWGKIHELNAISGRVL